MRHLKLFLISSVGVFGAVLISTLAIPANTVYADGVTINDIVALKDQYSVKNVPGNSAGPAYDMPYSITLKSPIFINGEHTYVLGNASSTNTVGLKCGGNQLMATLLFNNDSLNDQLRGGKRPDSLYYGMSLSPQNAADIADKCPKLIDDLKNVKQGKTELPEKVTDETQRELETALYMGAGAPLKDIKELRKFRNDPATVTRWCATSSQGVACSEDVWQQMLGKCAVDARGKVADTERYGRKTLSEAERNASAQSFFAECLSQRLYGDSSKAREIAKNIERQLKANIISAAVAGSEAKAAKAKQILEGLKKKIDDETNSTGGQDEEAQKSCGSEVGGIGWFMCPLLTAAVGFADSMWSLFENLLVLNPLEAKTDSYIYKTWLSFRDIANAALVVIFLVVVFSQVSNVGINNYGIKKMLPRLVLVAVGINVSFLIVQVAVDVANILGGSILGLLNSAAGGGQALDLSKMGWEQLIPDIITAGGLTVAGTAVVATGAVLAGPMASLIFVALLILPAIIGFLAGTLALIVRSAIIPVIAALAPLALVAYIMPNTQGIFDKWRKTFTSLLLLYPLAALYYGGLRLAALVMISDPKNGTLARLMGLTLLFVGTFVVCWLAIKANAITGKVAGAIQGGLNKITSPMQKSARDTATLMAAEKRAQFKNQSFNPTGKRWFDPRRYGPKGARGLVGRTMQNFDKSKRQRELNAKLYQADYDERVGQQVAGNIPKDIQDTTAAKAVMAKLYKEQVEAAAASLETMDISDVLAKALDTSASDSMRHAAASVVFERGSYKDKTKLLEGDFSGDGAEHTRMALASAYAKSDMKDIFGTRAAGEITKGNQINLQSELLDNAANINPQTVAGNANYANALANANAYATPEQQAHIQHIITSIDISDSLVATAGVEQELGRIRPPKKP